MKQIFDGYDEKKTTGGLKASGDFLMNEYADFSLGMGKSSSPDEKKPLPFGISYNDFDVTNKENKLLSTPAYPHESAKREEIDMDELNALLGLNDENFENKFAEIV